MGKSRHLRTDKEQSRVQELSHKNKELQRELAKLRRENERLRHSWTPPTETEIAEKDIPKKEKKNRICYSCGKGHLTMIKYGKPDGEWYYRECGVCLYRTRSKKLTPEVEE